MNKKQLIVAWLIGMEWIFILCLISLFSIYSQSYCENQSQIEGLEFHTYRNDKLYPYGMAFFWAQKTLHE